MNNKNHIIVVGPTPPPHHGVSMSMQMLLTSNLAEMYELHHVDLADRRGIEYVDKPDFHDVLLFVKQFLRLMRVIILHKPDLIYLAISQQTVGVLRDSFFILLAYLLQRKVLVHLHGGNFSTWYSRQSWLMKKYVSALMGRLSGAIVLGESLKMNFECFLTADRIFVVSNGVCLHELGQYGSKSIESTGRNRILYLGTLNCLKGVDVFIRSIPRVLEHHDDVEFVIAGSWSNNSDRIAVETYIRENDLSDYVTFTGFVENGSKADLLRSVDIFVFPGVQQEGQPLVVLEAMAAGLPILFTERGCLRETVVDGENGYLVNTNDPIDLAIQINRLLDFPDERSRMGAYSISRFQQNYTSEIFIANMAKVFTTVIAGK